MNGDDMCTEPAKPLIEQLVPLVSVFVSGAVALVSVFLNASVSKKMKDLEFEQAHAKLLIQKRFEIYVEFENIAAQMLKSSIDSRDSRKICDFMIDEKELKELTKRFIIASVNHIWLDKGKSTEAYLNLRAIFDEFLTSVRNIENQLDRQDIGKSFTSKIRKAAKNLISEIQADHLTLHETTKKLINPNASLPLIHKIWKLLNKPLVFRSALEQNTDQSSRQ